MGERETDTGGQIMGRRRMNRIRPFVSRGSPSRTDARTHARAIQHRYTHTSAHAHAYARARTALGAAQINHILFSGRYVPGGRATRRAAANNARSGKSGDDRRLRLRLAEFDRYDVPFASSA